MPALDAMLNSLFPAAPAPIFTVWPVWAQSTEQPVEFSPLPKKSAVKLWHRARDFDRQTHKKGQRGGALGPSGLQVLHVLLFDFLNFRTGRLDPSQKAIARQANVSPRTVSDALKRLKHLGILTWVRRCEARFENGRYVRRQKTNAYAILPEGGWLGYVPPLAAPLPHPSEWGKAEVMPSVLDEAARATRKGGDPRQVIRALELGPVGGIEAALARLGRAVAAAGN
jgi:DNA-binding MarR family transcriptional regulator